MTKAIDLGFFGQDDNAREKSMGALESDLIYDIGVNHGEDSRYYLDKGFRVIGVEANPLLAAELKDLFAEEIRTGQYTLFDGGIWYEEMTLVFYNNLTNDHWSSFDPTYGCRDGTQFETIEVPCTTIRTLLRRHGIPYYLKIDVEGADRMVLHDLCRESAAPMFVSVEEYGLQSVHDLYEAGYTEFQILAQRDKSWCDLPMPALEGRYVTRTFSGKDSGTFGRELPTNWIKYTDALAQFQMGIRRADLTYIGPPGEWYDIHAKRGKQPRFAR